MELSLQNTKLLKLFLFKNYSLKSLLLKAKQAQTFTKLNLGFFRFNLLKQINELKVFSKFQNIFFKNDYDDVNKELVNNGNQNHCVCTNTLNDSSTVNSSHEVVIERKNFHQENEKILNDFTTKISTYTRKKLKMKKHKTFKRRKRIRNRNKEHLN